MNCPRCDAPARDTDLRQLGGVCAKCLLDFAAADDEAPAFPNLEILDALGEGGMGVVYKARQKRLDRTVALKILSPRLSADPEFVGRFTREAKALAQLNHPNIVAIHEFGVHDGVPFLVMEYVEGPSLRKLLAHKKLTPERALEVVPQICDALQYAHSRGVVHRDIKPENVLIDGEGRVKIADFGLAKLASEDATRITRSDMVLGTPHYMAPEQIESPARVDHRADIYSLGVIFYEMLTGELPLGRFKLPSEMAKVDARLDPVVVKSLEKNRELRYQSASEVKEQVTRVRTAAPAPVPKPPTRPPRLWLDWALRGLGWSSLGLGLLMFIFHSEFSMGFRDGAMIGQLVSVLAMTALAGAAGWDIGATQDERGPRFRWNHAACFAGTLGLAPRLFGWGFVLPPIILSSVLWAASYVMMRVLFHQALKERRPKPPPRPWPLGTPLNPIGPAFLLGCAHLVMFLLSLGRGVKSEQGLQEFRAAVMEGYWIFTLATALIVTTLGWVGLIGLVRKRQTAGLGTAAAAVLIVAVLLPMPFGREAWPILPPAFILLLIVDGTLIGLVLRATGARIAVFELLTGLAVLVAVACGVNAAVLGGAHEHSAAVAMTWSAFLFVIVTFVLAILGLIRRRLKAPAEGPTRAAFLGWTCGLSSAAAAGVVMCVMARPDWLVRFEPAPLPAPRVKRIWSRRYGSEALGPAIGIAAMRDRLYLTYRHGFQVLTLRGDEPLLSNTADAFSGPPTCDDGWLVAAGTEELMIYRDPADWDLPKHKLPVRDAAGSRIAVAGGIAYLATPSGQAIAFELESGKKLWEMPLEGGPAARPFVESWRRVVVAHGQTLDFAWTREKGSIPNLRSSSWFRGAPVKYMNGFLVLGWIVGDRALVYYFIGTERPVRSEILPGHITLANYDPVVVGHRLVVTTADEAIGVDLSDEFQVRWRKKVGNVAAQAVAVDDEHVALATDKALWVMNSSNGDAIRIPFGGLAASVSLAVWKGAVYVLNSGEGTVERYDLQDP